MRPAPENIRREKAQAVLKALRDLAAARVATRREIKALQDDGKQYDTAKLKTWSALQSAEVRFNSASTEFAAAEGIDDG